MEKKRLDNVDDPDIPTSEIVNILDRAALSAKNFRKKSKIKTNNYKWFDNDLRSKQKTLVEKGELLSRFPCNPIIRGPYYKCYREYNKLRKYKKRHFKQTILDDLDRLRDSDPKQYWKLINSLKDSNNDDKTNLVEPDSWYTYFSNLNTVNESYHQRVKDIEETLIKMEELKEFNLLDYTITSKEIVDAMHHLKNGNASGLDGIPSEMLKAKQVVLFSLHYSKNYLILYFQTVYTQFNGPQHIYRLYTNQVTQACQKTIVVLK